MGVNHQTEVYVVRVRGITTRVILLSMAIAYQTITSGKCPVCLEHIPFGCKRSHPSRHHIAITGIKTKPVFIRKHNISQVCPQASPSLILLTLHTAVAWIQWNECCRASGLQLSLN
ncbi:hypothetical protein TNCV_2682631 [Trichonephila clavipes]|nr:hypothetical protein TNCV_2682631 [Trichonephila clavipes]